MLQAIMELQKSVGEINAKVDRLAGDLKSQGEKLDKLRIWAASLGGGAAVLAFLAWVITMWREQIAVWLSGPS
jgi:hypothetical protein